MIDNCVYHVITRSIAKYKVFNDEGDFSRMTKLLLLYKYTDFPTKFSRFNELPLKLQNALIYQLHSNSKELVNIIAYCIMPTHLHLIIKQIENGSISKYIAKILNSYTRYFNTKHGRKGPLWEGKFNNILVNTDEQLLHLTRYIHLNPSSAGLVNSPEEWNYSSYQEYINRKKTVYNITKYNNLIDIDAQRYKKFVDDRVGLQRDISRIKKLLLENYTG